MTLPDCFATRLAWRCPFHWRQTQEYHPHPAPGLKDSVYSLAISGDGSVVASGAPEACIRITDPRTDRKLMKLRGHTANIRYGTLSPLVCWARPACRRGGLQEAGPDSERAPTTY